MIKMSIPYMSKENKKHLRLIFWILALTLISSSIGYLTKSSIDTWYQTLNRSYLTPPNYIFGIVWSILYIMIATSGWLLWEEEYHSNIIVVKKLYISQLILNWIWTPLFFVYHLTGIALLCLSTIIILVLTIIIKSYTKITTVSLLLSPYLLWIIFAGYLNFYIWLYN